MRGAEPASRSGDCLGQRRGGGGGKPVVEHAAGLVAMDGEAMDEQDVAGIQALVHVHHGNAGFLIAGEDRRLDGGRAAMPGEDRGMQIEAGDARGIEDAFRQDLPVRHYHDEISANGAHLLDGVRRPQFHRLKHGDAAVERDPLDGRGQQFHAAPGGLVRLGDDGGDFMPAAEKPFECRETDVAGADVKDAHAVALWEQQLFCRRLALPAGGKLLLELFLAKRDLALAHR